MRTKQETSRPRSAPARFGRSSRSFATINRTTQPCLSGTDGGSRHDRPRSRPDRPADSFATVARPIARVNAPARKGLLFSQLPPPQPDKVPLIVIQNGKKE